MFQKELCKGIPNVTVWGVLGKRLQLKAYKQGVERWIGVNVIFTFMHICL
jgi:hypothetical protein